MEIEYTAVLTGRCLELSERYLKYRDVPIPCRKRYKQHADRVLEHLSNMLRRKGIVNFRVTTNRDVHRVFWPLAQ